MVGETITYEELANRVGNMYLFNKAPDLDPEFGYEGLENGTLDYCTEHDKSERDSCIESDCEFQNYDIHQWYLANPGGADYLKRVSDELVFYSEVLDEYIWGVTHYGTAWSHVEVDINAN